MKPNDSDILGFSLESKEELSLASKRRMPRNNDSGFTLVELIVVSAILGVLATLAMPAYNKLIEGVKITRAISEIRAIEKDILAKVIDTNALPNSLNDIGRGTLKDPWGSFYQYLNIASGGTPRELFTELNTDFDLYSFGPDRSTEPVISAASSLDDILRASDGSWVGVAENF